MARARVANLDNSWRSPGDAVSRVRPSTRFHHRPPPAPGRSERGGAGKLPILSDCARPVFARADARRGAISAQSPTGAAAIRTTLEKAYMRKASELLPGRT
jgi:hypothetical protein